MQKREKRLSHLDCHQHSGRATIHRFPFDRQRQGYPLPSRPRAVKTHVQHMTDTSHISSALLSLPRSPKSVGLKARGGTVPPARPPLGARSNVLLLLFRRLHFHFEWKWRTVVFQSLRASSVASLCYCQVGPQWIVQEYCPTSSRLHCSSLTSTRE